MYHIVGRLLKAILETEYNFDGRVTREEYQLAQGQLKHFRNIFSEIVEVSENYNIPHKNVWTFCNLVKMYNYIDGFNGVYYIDCPH